jgi:hypothetical protein
MVQKSEALIAERPAVHVNNRFAVLIALVLLADILMFREEFGINLFLFAVAVSAGILLSARKTFRPRAAAAWMGFAAFASLPLLIGPSPMGITIAVIAVMCVALAASKLLPRRLTRLPLILIRFLVVIPLRLLEDASRRSAIRPKSLPVGHLGVGLRAWILPLILAAVFLTLFAMANPVIDDVIRSIDLFAPWRLLDFWRIGFWLLVAISVWAMLRPRLLRRRVQPATIRPVAPASENVLLGHASVLRSLIVFNAMFGVQTLLDLLYLWGGADLPEGMTHAEYAHRGAYPLIATALLAGAFVLMAMRRGGPGDNSVVIRGLVHVWIAQNILLCLSAILRLDLYVEVYSLTELRVAAGIWMGLVAIGLAFILLRILLRRSNEWLIAMNLASLTIVLYATAFIDIPGFIARFNVEHSLEVSREGAPLDVDYLYSLGPSAIPALGMYLDVLPHEDFLKTSKVHAYVKMLAHDFEKKRRDWRSWNLNSARLGDYIDANLARWQKNGINGFDEIQRELK